MKPAPSVTVVMTVFNGEPYIRAAVRSVIAQRFEDFELLIVDDGSEDGTVEFLRGLEDPRIRFYEAGRIGRPRALNLAVSAAASPLVAVLDADDLALSDRLARPIEFLRDHPKTGLVGSMLRPTIDGAGEELATRDLGVRSDRDIRLALCERNPLFHSSVTFRKSLHSRIGGYDGRLRGLVDWDFYVRAASITQLANIPAPLAVKRMHPAQYFGWGQRPETRDQTLARARVLFRTVRHLEAPSRNLWRAARYYLAALRMPA